MAVVRYVVIALCSVHAVFAVPQKDRHREAENEAFRIVQEDRQNGLTVEFAPQQYDPLPVEIGGKHYVSYRSLTGGVTVEEGKPELPVEGILIAIPPYTQPVVRILESRFEEALSDPVAPVPHNEYREDVGVVKHYHRDEMFYSSHNRFYPSTLVQAGEVSELRHQVVAKLSVSPLQFNPVSGKIRMLTHLRFRIDFQPVQFLQSHWVPVHEEDPHYEAVYRGLILNYEDGKQWRGRAIDTPQFIDTTGGWFTPGRQYFRIPIATDGFYRLTAQQMRDAGLEPAIIDFPTLAIYQKGRSIPLHVVHQGNLDSVAIEFYAKRNYGVNSFFDPFSDTSFCFLTWGDTAARRFLGVNSLPSPPQVVATWYVEKLHLEKDSSYYDGVNATESRNTEVIPGEGWYWRNFNPGNQIGFMFNVDSVKRGTGVPVTLRARLHGMTVCVSNCTSATHIAAFRLNSTTSVPVGTIQWSNNTEAIFTASLPDSLLRSGTNVLWLTSNSASGQNISRFYLDWFEIEFPRPLLASNNQVLFTYPQTGGVVEFQIDGFSSSAVDIFDLTLGRKIQPLSTGNRVMHTMVAFRDTVTPARQYLAIERNQRSTPIRLEPKVFGNLRSLNNGADYVIVTHKNFRSAADRLAQHRRSAGRLRTVVVDVQDVFDEFNFGHKSAVAVRDFLRQAYYNWRRPSPVYVLMLGDASQDPKGLRLLTIKKDYVPSYGFPPSDNAIVSFHPVKNYLPYMLIGRIPAEDSLQAHRVVTKVIQYDTPPVGEWNKSFLFVTGGNTSGERILFNSYSNSFINNYVLPAPVGGAATRYYKTSDAVIDGEFKDSIRESIRRGIVYYNFIGHSGGRIMGVDPGSPNEFQNTNGQLFFVNSTSCWIGLFAASNSNVYGEDLLMADNRGAVGVWAASFLGDAGVGYWLTTKFLSSLQSDYARSFGHLTTLGRLHYWAINTVTTPTVIAVLHQHPLMGDPYTLFAVPTRPDMAFVDTSLTIGTHRPTQDSMITLKVKLYNYGLVPTDSVRLSFADSYTDVFGTYRGIQRNIPSITLPPTKTADSIFVQWDIRGQAGTHVLTATLDSANAIQELTETNNTTQQTFYVYLNTIAPLKPPDFSIQESGAVALTVSVPAGNDTTPLQYYFELDTLADFSSGGNIVSPPVVPNDVSATWTTPPLANHGTYFWRSRTFDGSRYGAWTTSSLLIDDSSFMSGRMRWNQRTKRQFASNRMEAAVASDSGVLMARTNGLPLYVRSVGNRANADQDFYSIIRVGSQTIFGLWWEIGNRFIVARINDYTGAFQYKAFDVNTVGTFWADSMANYLRTTPLGHYVAVTVVFNGSTTTAQESLRVQLDRLGAINHRSLANGHAWAFISRKGATGPLMTPLESWSPTAIAVCSLQMPTYYNAGVARVYSPFIGPAHQWHTLQWSCDTTSPGVGMVLKVVGVRPNNVVDTLMSVLPSQSTVDLSSLDAMQYPRLHLLAFLSNTDPQYTPKLLQWDVEYVPPAEVATSAWAFSAYPSVVNQDSAITVEMDVYNLGYLRADSVQVIFSRDGPAKELHRVVIDSIPIGGSRHVSASVAVKTVPPGSNILRTRIEPGTGENDLYDGNNVVLFPFTVVSAGVEPAPKVKVFFDGKQIVNGEYVSPTPLIRIDFLSEEEAIKLPLKVKLNDHEVNTMSMEPKRGDSVIPLQKPEDARSPRVFEFRPQLADGSHVLSVLTRDVTVSDASVDSVLTAVQFSVLSSTKLLDVYNYPNPFRDGTFFTFVVTGTRTPDEVHIKIYSVAGRLLRTVIVPGHAVSLGFNRVYWDGRDQDGDEVANGTYFYNVIARTGDRNVESLNRFAKVK